MAILGFVGDDVTTFLRQEKPAWYFRVRFRFGLSVAFCSVGFSSVGTVLQSSDGVKTGDNVFSVTPSPLFAEGSILNSVVGIGAICPPLARIVGLLSCSHAVFRVSSFPDNVCHLPYFMIDGRLIHDFLTNIWNPRMGIRRLRPSNNSLVYFF